MRLASYIFFLSFIFILFAQDKTAQDKKTEKETKLKPSEAPIELKQILAQFLDEARKVTYYEESDGSLKSYEVKFRFNDSYYSIEFDDSLRLEDIEVIVNESQLSGEVLSRVKKHLSNQGKFKIDKIQKQFSSDKWADDEVVNQALNNATGDIVRYELEVSLKTESEWKAFEMLFSSDGRFISQREIIKRSSDFVLY